MNAIIEAEEISPVTDGLVAVRGFSRSYFLSIQRLNPMAPLRAPAIARVIHTTCMKVGAPLVATSIATKAKGNAKMVCENFTSER